MKPKAHLFVVNDDTMPVHIQRGFCGISKPRRLNSRGNLNVSYFGQIADLMNIKIGDLVFFYMMTIKDRAFKLQDENIFDELEQGYYGVFEVDGRPFYSDREIKGSYPFGNYYIFGSDTNPHYSNFTITTQNETFPPKVLFGRIPIKPIEHYEEDLGNKFVDDNQAYIDKTDEGTLSTLLFKKIKRAGEERSVTPILPEEASKIARLIFKQKKKNFPLNIDANNFVRNDDVSKEIQLDLSSGDGVSLDLEYMLEAYMLFSLNNDKPLVGLESIIGDPDEIEFCGNQIQYGISGNKVDILLLHRKELGGSTNYRFRSTVFELKKDDIKKEDILQIIDYQKWIAQLTTFNNLKAIQPVLIGKKPSIRMRADTRQRMEESLNKIKELGVSTPRFFEYNLSIDGANNINVSFTEFDINEIIN